MVIYMINLNIERLQDQRIWDEYTRHRKALGITQTELAQSLGKSQGLVTHYETGRQGQREIFRSPLEGTIEMCIAIGLPTEGF